LVSFLQSGSSSHLTVAADLKGHGRPTTWTVRQDLDSVKKLSLEPQNRGIATLPVEPPMTLSLTKFAGHCRKIANRVFGNGYEWVLPVSIVVSALIAVALYSFMVLRDNHAANRPSHLEGESLRESLPARRALGETRGQQQPRQQAGSIQRATMPTSAPFVVSNQSDQHPSTAVAAPQSRSDSGLSVPATASLMLSRPENIVPPLCPTLLLPCKESRFAVNVDAMEGAETGSQLNVCGFDSKPLLKLKIDASEVGTRLNIYVNTSGQVDTLPRCSIIAPRDDVSPFVIHGPGDKYYGTFQNFPGKSTLFEVKVDDRAVMHIEGNTSSLQLSAFTPDPQNHPVALAAVNKQDYKDGEAHFEIRVLPGFDSMLVIAVVMAIMLFIDAN